MLDENEAVRFTAGAAVFKLSAIAKATGLAKSKASRPKPQKGAGKPRDRVLQFSPSCDGRDQRQALSFT